MVRSPHAPRPSRFPTLALCAGLAVGGAPAIYGAWDEFIDQVGQQLTLAAADGVPSLQVSGKLDLTAYRIDEPVADLRYTAPDTELLFSPVLRVYADARLGAGVQARAQLRVDRGFDPTDRRIEARLEEAALRLPAWPGSRSALHVGRFATVFGSWARRNHAWDYPFITAPLAQENLTGLWDGAAPGGPNGLQKWAHVRPVGDAAAIAADERERIPVMWGSVYAIGAALATGGEHWDLATEFKNTGLSSRPDTWNETDADVWRDPAAAARLGWTPDPAWNLGLSFARGPYLSPDASKLAPGHDRGDYVQTSLGHDFSYAWHHFQFWGELVAARFAVPTIGHADTLTYALETKYRFTPRWAGFARWSQQFFAPISVSGGDEIRWGRDASRIEAGVMLRLAAQAQLKLQGGLLHERPSTEDLTPSAAMQLSLGF